MMSAIRSKRKVNDKEDRLSNLPDDVLTKILSCLKTKEAVRAGILSTRWKSLWLSVHTLDLFYSDFKFKSKEEAEARFSNFLDRVLTACESMSSFEKIRIHGRNCDPYRLVSWLRVALERNVSDLRLGFSGLSYDPPCQLSRDLFSKNNLVVLKLCVDMSLYFQTASSCFPNLKVLELENILYKDDASMPNLLSSCPVLEELFIVRPRWDNLRTLNILSCSLKRLKDHERGELPDPDVPHCLLSSLKTVQIDSNSEYGVEKAMYLLINARVLEKMVIRSRFSNKIFDNICDLISKNPKNWMSTRSGKSGKEIVISFL